LKAPVTSLKRPVRSLSLPALELFILKQQLKKHSAAAEMMKSKLMMKPM